MAHEPAADLLLAVRAGLSRLDALLAYEDLLSEARADELREARASVLRRLDQHELSVAIVGEKKAGKSTLLNALLGAPLLGAAVRECTGTVTLIRWGERPDYLARRFDGGVERFAALHPDTGAALRAEIEAVAPMAASSPEAAGFVAALQAELDELEALRSARFAQDVRALTDVDARGQEIAWLELWWPARFLPDDLVLIDTPGVNTEHEANRARAWAAIEERADGCLLVSDLNQAVSRSTLDFLDQLRPIVPHVLLALTKLDRAMENAEEVGGDPEEEAAEAREVAVRRFARASGRRPAEIGAIAVSALPVLEGEAGPHAAHFEAEVGRLRELLRRERGVVLATRAAAVLTSSGARLEGAAQQAVEAATQRLAALEAQSLRDPEAFAAAQLAALRPQAKRKAAGVIAELEAALPDLLVEVDARMSGIIRATRTRAELQRVVDELRATLGRELYDGLGHLRRQARSSVNEAQRALIPAALAALRERYRIAAELRAVEVLPPEPSVDVGDVATGIALSAELGDLVEQHDAEQRAWGLKGAAVGAALGVVLSGGVAVPVALALGLGGGAASLFQPLSRLQDRCCDGVTKALSEARGGLAEQLRAATPQLTEDLLAQLDGALSLATLRFAEWIAGVIAEESAGVELARARVGEVTALAEQLRAQAEELEAAREGLVEGSQGLAV